MNLRLSSRLLRLLCLPAVFVICAGAGSAQIYDPVQWKLEFDTDEVSPGSSVVAHLTAVIDDTWHIYSSTTPEGIPLTVSVMPNDAVRDWRAYQPEPEVVFDPNFQADVEWYSREAVFLIELDLAPDASGRQDIHVGVRYGACDPRQCLPPKRKSANASLTVASSAEVSAVEIPAGYQPMPPSGTPGLPAEQRISAPGAATMPTEFGAGDQGLVTFALLALGFGFVAVLTPCVFPMIPIYIGSFMSDGKRSWRSVLGQAFLFCLGVIVLFTSIGGALSIFLGPFGLSQAGSNPWVNLLTFAIMSALALSMMGAFEITIPSGWTTAATTRSSGPGVVATLMLSLVFTLASFACTGPFIGSLLAGSLGAGGAAYPVVGMGLFSVGLSAPFFLLALFPALMNRLPRSGVWLAVSKRVTGIVILIVALKYFSNADKVFGWNLLGREMFLAVWFALGFGGALYVWGILRLSDDGSAKSIGLIRLGTGVLLLAFALRLVPGMLGGRLGELEAFVPEPSGAGSPALGTGEPAWLKDDYEGALERARAEGKTLLVSFTGYSCSNCKWMKANMFTKPDVSELVRNFVLVELYTDGYDEQSEAHQVLQVEKFRSSSIPFYALIQPDGTVAAVFSGQTRDVDEFLAFLKSAA